MALGHGTSIVRNGLVLYLDAANKKSYPATGTVWNDLSGNGRNGTLVNAPVYSTTNSGIFSFNGTDEYAVGTIPAFTLGSSATIEAYVKFNAVNNTSTIFGHGVWDTSSFMGMIVDQSQLLFRRGTTDAALSSPTTLFNGRWYHLTLTITPGQTTGYCNGLSQGTTSLAIPTNTNTQYLISSRSSSNPNEFVNGDIAAIRVYNRVLTAAEVAQNFEATRNRYGI